MSFAAWEAMPPSERLHRTLLYLAKRDAEIESHEEAERDRWLKKEGIGNGAQPFNRRGT